VPWLLQEALKQAALGLVEVTVKHLDPIPEYSPVNTFVESSKDWQLKLG
jgi:hypothetical protein